MSERKIQNARIEGTFLGIEDHGILTFMIRLEYASGVQSFGQYMLDYRDKEKDEIVGNAQGFVLIRRVLEVVGVDSWEKLRGKTIRADADYGKVYRIGNIIKDEWCDAAEIMNKAI